MFVEKVPELDEFVHVYLETVVLLEIVLENVGDLGVELRAQNLDDQTLEAVLVVVEELLGEDLGQPVPLSVAEHFHEHHHQHLRVAEELLGSAPETRELLELSLLTENVVDFLVKLCREHGGGLEEDEERLFFGRRPGARLVGVERPVLFSEIKLLVGLVGFHAALAVAVPFVVALVVFDFVLRFALAEDFFADWFGISLYRKNWAYFLAFLLHLA